MENEIWKPIIGYEDLYEISNLGRVKSLPKIRHTPIKGVTFLRPEKILKPNKLKPSIENSYTTICLVKNGIKKTFSIHVLVAKHFIGECPPGKQVNHINTIKSDNKLENIEYLTPKENTEHAFKNDLRHPAKGEQLPQTKLNKEQVIKIKELLKQKINQKYIAKIFNVTPGAISSISTQRNWKHI